MNWNRTLPLLAIASAALLAGCGSDLYPAATNPVTTVDPITDMGVAIQGVYGQITWWILGIAVLVGALMAYILVVFRDRGQTENPKQIHGNPALEIGWTLLPVVIVILILVPTVRTIFELGDAAPADKVEVEVVGKRWWWEFRYIPDGDLIKKPIVTANQLHLPANKTASLLITSESVIHSFWAPRLGGKRDAVPGRTNRMWFTLLPPCDSGAQPCSPEQPADGKPLVYDGECAEFCGESHAQMKFDVVLHTEDDFRTWAQGMIEPAEPEDALAKAGKEAFGELGCGGCHAITGHDRANGIIGPNLTNYGERIRLGASGHMKNDEKLAQWIVNPDELKPGVTMNSNISRGPKGANDGMNVVAMMPSLDTDNDGYPNFTDEQLDQLVAYLNALQIDGIDVPVPEHHAKNQ